MQCAKIHNRISNKKCLSGPNVQISKYQTKLYRSQKELNMYSQSSVSALESQIKQYQVQIDEMNQDISVLIAELQSLKQEHSTLINSSMKEFQYSSQRIASLEEQVIEFRAKSSATTAKLSQFNQLESQVRELRAESSLWRSRYTETEMRLKEYDALKVAYAELQLTQNSWEIRVNDLQAQLKDSAGAQSAQFEMERASWKRLMDEQSNNHLNEFSSLKNELMNISKQSSQISLENEQMKVKLTQVQLQLKAAQDELALKSKDWTTMIAERDTLKQRLGQMGVSSEELRVRETRIIELESAISMFKIEIERLKNIRSEQELRIQVMIQKVTEQESELNILRQENTRYLQKSEQLPTLGGSQFERVPRKL